VRGERITATPPMEVTHDFEILLTISYTSCIYFLFLISLMYKLKLIFEISIGDHMASSKIRDKIHLCLSKSE
jgi:hypothetical protein